MRRQLPAASVTHFARHDFKWTTHGPRLYRTLFLSLIHLPHNLHKTRRGSTSMVYGSFLKLSALSASFVFLRLEWPDLALFPFSPSNGDRLDSPMRQLDQSTTSESKRQIIHTVTFGHACRWKCAIPNYPDNICLARRPMSHSIHIEPGVLLET